MSKIGLWVAVSLLTAAVLGGAPARADIDFSSTAACPGVWMEVPSPKFETVKVCKRKAPVAAVRAERKRRIAVARPLVVAPHKRMARSEPVHVDRVAVAETSANKECTSLMCPQFLLTGVGF